MKSAQFQQADKMLICPIDICQFRCLHLTEFSAEKLVVLLWDVKKHAVKSTFASHISITHKKSSVKHAYETVLETQTENVTETPGVSTENDFSENLEAGQVDEA